MAAKSILGTCNSDTYVTDYRSFLTSVIPSIVIILYHVCSTHEIPLETGCQIPKRVYGNIRAVVVLPHLGE